MWWILIDGIFQESAPLQIHKGDMAIEIWSGLQRRGIWKGHNITIKKFSRKEITASRIREMLVDTVALCVVTHPHIVPVCDHVVTVCV